MRTLPAALFLLALGLSGCPEPATGLQPSQGRTGGTDGATDAAARVDTGLVDETDAAPDAGPAPDGGLGEGRACTWTDDCPMGDCIDGACTFEQPNRCFQDPDACAEGETCGDFFMKFWCYTDCELEGTCGLRPRPCATNTDCPAWSHCYEDRCVNSCITDADCPEQAYCYEGLCIPWEDPLEGTTAWTPMGEPGQLYAGVAVTPMDFPIGVSMAGYGLRPGPRTPYQIALGGSDRVFERQDVRVLVLSTDEDLMILLRLPLCWSTDYLLALTAEKLAAKTGVNYLDRIITTATHSHSQPGRFWNLIPTTGFGSFGYGSFSKEMVNRYAESFAVAIEQALQNVKPARFGWEIIGTFEGEQGAQTIEGGFDPTGRIHTDRREESRQFVDDRMLVWKVEDTTGVPMAAGVHFAIHGTHMEEPWVTGDVAAGIEVVATNKLSAAEDTPVPVFFMQGNAADISPRGDDGTSVPWGKIQAVGHRVWPIFKAAYDRLETSGQLELEMLTRRIPVSYDHMGYDRGAKDFRDNRGDIQPYGAFQCVAASRSRDEDPHMDGALGCVINLQKFLGVPVVQLQKTTLSAARIGNLVLTTLPGEPSSELGVTLNQLVERTAHATPGFEDVQAFNLGYSQDHHLYILLEDDWFRGGYEAAQGLWGWREGRYLLGEAHLLASQLFTAEKESNVTPIKPTWWPFEPDDALPHTATAGVIGATTADVASRAARGTLLDFEWNGGHPGMDLPRVRLEIQGDGGAFEPALRAGGAPFDDGGFESLTIYRGDYEADHRWAGRWELPFDLPLGTYRFVAEGQAIPPAGEPVAYLATSTEFVVEPAPLVAREQVVSAEGRLALKLTYADGPSTDDGSTPFDELRTEGHLLRIDPERGFAGNLKRYSFIVGPAAAAGQYTIQLTAEGGASTEITADSGEGDTRVSLVTSRSEGGEEITESFDGWPSTRIEADLPAPGRYTVTVTGPNGNVGQFELVWEQ